MMSVTTQKFLQERRGSFYITILVYYWMVVRIVYLCLQRYLLCDCRDCCNEMKRLTVLYSVSQGLFSYSSLTKETDYLNSYVKLNIHSLF